MSKGKNTAGLITMAFLITGNLVGAGILGLPINTGLAGFPLSIAAMAAVWGLMFGSAVIISDQVIANDNENFDLPSMFRTSLGPVGQWIASAANLVILYGLLTAYLSGGATILATLLKVHIPQWTMILVFFTVVTALTLFGLSVVRRGNVLLMALMWTSFAGLILLAAPKVEVQRLNYTDLGMLPSALPIMVTAFHFHNIIPTVCRDLNRNRKTIRKALLLGTILGLVMNFLWVGVTIGALPVADHGQNNILYSFDHQLPATIPLGAIINSPYFITCSLVFAIIAITTSYLTNGTALMSFMRDLSRSFLNIKSAPLEALLTFVPPLLVTLAYPNLFLKALNVVGGVGISLLFGILPGILLFRQALSSKVRMPSVVMIVCFLAILFLEVAQETGLLRIDPDVETWKAVLGPISK